MKAKIRTRNNKQKKSNITFRDLRATLQKQKKKQAKKRRSGARARALAVYFLCLKNKDRELFIGNESSDFFFGYCLKEIPTLGSSPQINTPIKLRHRPLFHVI